MVGFMNTLVDFSLLFGLVSLIGWPVFFANVSSTSVALFFSYLLNKRAVFGDTDTHNTRKIILFITVTLTGLWVLQGIILMTFQSIIGMFAHFNDEAILLGAKVIATAATAIWNYLWYSRVIFKKLS